ncbi:hypothetical protein Goari_013527, partial [Gossypium aridum]|nr:hypothetical protein [Gossypium aridum]
MFLVIKQFMVASQRLVLDASRDSSLQLLSSYSSSSSLLLQLCLIGWI